jgi:hypothetical protein
MPQHDGQLTRINRHLILHIGVITVARIARRRGERMQIEVALGRQHLTANGKTALRMEHNRVLIAGQTDATFRLRYAGQPWVWQTFYTVHDRQREGNDGAFVALWRRLGLDKVAGSGSGSGDGFGSGGAGPGHPP